MARPAHHLPPRDYAEPDLDEHDPTGYYWRKQKHREEMLPYLAACFIAAAACVVVAVVWQLIA